MVHPGIQQLCITGSSTSWLEKKLGAQSNPDLIIYSLNIELMREQNKEKINSKYLEIARTLRTAGAEALVICANTPPHAYSDSSYRPCYRKRG